MTTKPYPSTFDGAVALVRDFYSKYPLIMAAQGPAHPAIGVLKCGSPLDQQVAAKLVVNGKSPAIPVMVSPELRSDDAAKIACIYDGVIHRARAHRGADFSVTFAEINMTEREAAAVSKVSRAMILHGSHAAPILLPPTLNTCWRRFIATKELMQILRGTVIPPELKPVKDQLSDAFQILNNMWAGKDIPSESFALICAIEVLLPWENREAFHEIARLEGGRLLAAKAFMVPLYFVEVYFDTRYQVMSAGANKNI